MPRVCTSQPAKAELQAPRPTAPGSSTAGNRERLGCSQRSPKSSALGRAAPHPGPSAACPDPLPAPESKAEGTADSGPSAPALPLPLPSPKPHSGPLTHEPFPDAPSRAGSSPPRKKSSPTSWLSPPCTTVDTGFQNPPSHRTDPGGTPAPCILTEPAGGAWAAPARLPSEILLPSRCLDAWTPGPCGGSGGRTPTPHRSLLAPHVPGSPASAAAALLSRVWTCSPSQGLLEDKTPHAARSLHLLHWLPRLRGRDCTQPTGTAHLTVTTLSSPLGRCSQAPPARCRRRLPSPLWGPRAAAVPLA